MIRKSQLFLAVAALAGMNVAMAACNTTQWGQGKPPNGASVGSPIADGPVNSDGNAALTARYSGKCGLSADAAGDFVQDDLPSAEPSYISRFYVLPNNTGEATVMQAMADEATDYAVFKSTFDATASAFKFYGSNGAGGFGTPVSVTTVNGAPIVVNRWYMIETDYKRNSGTHLHIKGEEKTLDTTRVIAPGIPAVLAFKPLEIVSVKLSPAAAQSARAKANVPIGDAKKKETREVTSLKALEGPDETDKTRYLPFPETSTGRRTALARCITDKQNPLTARVAVNHLWLRHFGQPLVANVFDFGKQAKRPPLQDVLDFLAIELM